MAEAMGLLLVNLGTPEGDPGKGPSSSQVRRYLKEFLMDPYVIDIAKPLRWLLVHAVILPARPRRSAEAYRKVWTDQGSPLLVHHLELASALRAELARGGGRSWEVVAAMRYGKPSIAEGFRELEGKGIRETLVVPLYPQYSLAATRSSIEECRNQATRSASGMKLRFFPPFYDAPGFLDAFAEVARPHLAGYGFDHFLFSFHGLPERHIIRTDRSAPGGSHCLATPGCCEWVGEVNRDCYRAQCFATARGLAARLGLDAERYTVCFQSRLGRTPWIGPSTEILYGQLVARGVKKLAVMCPAFVADCLETLEEIQIRGRDQFRSLGGEELRLVPSLNASPAWVRRLAGMIAEMPGGMVDGFEIS